MSFATCVATASEKRRALPVDALVPNAIFSATHAITIDAPPEQVWPFFVERAYAMLARLPRPLIVAFAALGHRFMEARHLRGIQRRASRHLFRTPEGEASFFAAYDAVLKQWPVPFQEIDIPTRFGTTHVIASGPTDAPPLVLLHGYMATAMMWALNIGDFSQRHRVYAIDTMGQPGKSIPREPISSAADYVAWLTATLDALHLDRVNLVGQSFGGWLALKYAIAAPERVKTLALLSAGGIQPISMQFRVRGMLMMLVPARFTVKSFWLWSGFRGVPREIDHWPVMDLLYLGIKHFRMPPPVLRIGASPVSDDELRTMRMPVLFLMGTNEVLCDAAAALARARRLVPDFQGELIPHCSHDMCASRCRIVNAVVLDFLAKGYARSGVEGRTEALCESPSRS
jgi:pimeloyl-ACP methyl ester carboxylesterase